ncbi:hypothetical protein [Prevotellamassilia timonensis]|uniref:hypothetical protein n=1 Tax=Prevotellamassilia timonensis TaxID=1852370 RepID=UPI00307A1708
MKFRHSIRNSQSFLFSAKESDDAYYDVAYELTKKLFIGMAKYALAFNSTKYDIYEPPFVFRERQLDTLIMPVLASLCKGLAFAEYPMIRNSQKKGLEIENSQGRVDYWCIYKDYSVVIEVKHSYDNFETPCTNDERLLQRWRTMNIVQLGNVKDDIKHFEERTKGVIRLGLHFVTSHSSTNPSDNIRETYISQERVMLDRLYKDLKTVASPDFMSVWEMDKDMVYYDNDRAYPGLIVMAKFFKDIKHKGSED